MLVHRNIIHFFNRIVLSLWQFFYTRCSMNFLNMGIVAQVVRPNSKPKHIKRWCMRDLWGIQITYGSQIWWASRITELQLCTVETFCLQHKYSPVSRCRFYIESPFSWLRRLESLTWKGHLNLKHEVDCEENTELSWRMFDRF